ncbi:hypothetical protein SynM161_00866 [Synechococcus sp. M16.1]|nr:hypothetical protein SynM161_00866 [Synechococcus sp. M16.1]
MLSLLKQWIKGIPENLHLSKSQLLWLTLGIGLVLGYALALLFHR